MHTAVTVSARPYHTYTIICANTRRYIAHSQKYVSPRARISRSTDRDKSNKESGNHMRERVCTYIRACVRGGRNAYSVITRGKSHYARRGGRYQVVTFLIIITLSRLSRPTVCNSSEIPSATRWAPGYVPPSIINVPRRPIS